MAGAGYKLFNTGDVLTAAQVNTYLNEQTVMVFANSTARTTALSGVLAEGMVSYLQDTNAVEVYNGSAWVGVSGAGDVTEVQAGTGISVASGTGPIPVVTNTMATAVDAKGDLIVGTGADTFARLAVGTNGHTLVADSSTATGLAYAAPAGGGANWSLLNSGGTALTGAATITVSGISSADKILVLVDSASSANASSNFNLRFNADSGSNYSYFGTVQEWGTTYSAADHYEISSTQPSFDLGRLASNAASVSSGYLLASGCNASGNKAVIYNFGADTGGGSGARHYNCGGVYTGSSAISSVSILSSSGNFDNGTIYVYTSA
jgi:hypothetical protein